MCAQDSSFSRKTTYTYLLVGINWIFFFYIYNMKKEPAFETAGERNVYEEELYVIIERNEEEKLGERNILQHLTFEMKRVTLVLLNNWAEIYLSHFLTHTAASCNEMFNVKRD